MKANKIIKATKQEMQGQIESQSEYINIINEINTKFLDELNVLKGKYLAQKTLIESYKQDAEIDSKIKNEQNQQISDLRDTRKELNRVNDELENENNKFRADYTKVSTENWGLQKQIENLTNVITNQARALAKLSSL